jgi:CDP-glucose 4,6-dehydratase
MENTYLEVFKSKKVFITGHTGFKGSWLAYILYQAGADVLGYALPPVTENSHFNLLNLENKIKHVEGDICNRDLLINTLSEFQPEFVFHLAAQALVRPSYQDPVLTFKTNVEGSANLLEAVRLCESVRSLVYITSDKCYENVEWIWGYRENDILGGKDPYSASKAAAEIVFYSYQNSFFKNRANFGSATTRAGNVIGGGDWAIDRIIPDCIRSISKNTSITLRNPNATRPWQHVLEPLSGYLLLANKLYYYQHEYDGAWNFGPLTKEVKTVKEVAEQLIENIGTGVIEVQINSNNVHEANLLQLNCDKANQLLNWFPRWSVNKTIAETAIWYKSYLEAKDVEKITHSQIVKYFNL